MSARMITNVPAAKVVSATGAAGIADAFMMVFLWGAGETWPNHPIPLLVQGALLVLVTSACTYLAAYFTPPAGRDQIVASTPAPPVVPGVPLN